MPFPLSAILAVAQSGVSLYDSYAKSQAQKRARRARASYFDTNIKPLLDESINIEEPDWNSIREAELANPIFNMQKQMEELSLQRSQMESRSGFNSSGFVNELFNKQKDSLAMSMDEQLYKTNKMVDDMQSQFNDILNQNKLRAKELEYSYKFG